MRKVTLKSSSYKILISFSILFLSVLLFDLYCITASFASNKETEYLKHTPNAPRTASDWHWYKTTKFGYVISYPIDLPIQERVNQYQAYYQGVPSDLQFGERIHIITRIPPLSKEYIRSIWPDASEVLLKGNIHALKTEQHYGRNPYDIVNSKHIEYFIEANGATYFLIFNSTGDVNADWRDEHIFGKMVASFTVLPSRTYRSNEAVDARDTDGFDFPVDPRDGSSGRPPWYASFNAQNPYLNKWSNCYGKTMSQLQHTGEDWFRNAGSNVYAIANGRVIWAGRWDNADAIIIEHRLPSGQSTPWGNPLIYSMYGHVNRKVSQWSDVSRGQVIAQIYNWGSNSHTHFEIRRYGNMQDAPEWVNGRRLCMKAGWPGPGYTDTDANPEWWGYIKPSDWIDHHRPGGGGGGNTCPAPSLLSPGDGETVHERHVRLDWAAPQCSGLRGYTLHITTGSDPEDGIIKDTGVGPDEYTYDFPHDGTFYWHVAAWSGDNRGPWASRRIVIDTSQPPPSNCPINADQIALFMDDDYRGRCVVKNVGEYPNPGAIGLPNDSISSVKVGSNVKAVLCKHDGFNDCETFEHDDNHLGDNHIGNDQVSSVKVERRESSCPINADQVALFEHDNFRGRCVVKGIGEYPNPPAMGFPNDTASSIRIGSNVKAILCKHDGFNDCETFEHDDSHLSDNHIGNDQLSSLKVQRRTQSPPAKPRMKSPQDGATISQGADVVLDWDSSTNATEYAAEYWKEGGARHNSGHHSRTEWHLGKLSPGRYHWHVEAYNMGGAQWSGWSDEWTFEIRPPAPSATFDAWPLSGQAPLKVRFHIVSTDNMSSCTWHYGDGQTGHSCNSYHDHTYSQAGDYTVRLDVSGPGGSNNKIRNNYISVSSKTATNTPTPTPTRTRRPPTNTPTPTATTTPTPSAQDLQFSGRVIDQDGRPLPRFAYIQVWGSNLSGRNSIQRWVANLVTDANGNFFWKAPTGVRYRFYYFHPYPINNWSSYKVIGVTPGIGGEVWNGDWIRYPIVSLGNGNYSGSIFTLSTNNNSATATPTPSPTPNLPTDEWLGEYYDNESLQGRPKLVRRDENIDFDWKEASPAPGLPSDHFSIRWVRKIDFSAGYYTFMIERDDGARLWIDDQLIFDKWTWGRDAHEVKQNLSEGEHIVRFEMYEHEGWAMAKLAWTQGDTTPPTGDFTEPARDAEVSAPVWLRVDVHDDAGGSGIDYIKFTSNGTGRWQEISRDRTPPYEVLWDMSGVPTGQRFMIGAEIHDKAGNRTDRIRWITKQDSSSSDTTPPSGDFTAPRPNASITAPVWLRVNASDSESGIDYVKFTSNGTGRWQEISRDRTPPYEVLWDMSGVPAGQRFMIGAEIHDKAGNRTDRIRWITKQSNENDVSPDSYEPDNAPDMAKWYFFIDSPDGHNFHVSNDEDWIKIEGLDGRYVLETYNLGSNADTVMELYYYTDDDPLARDDDSGVGLASRITYTFWEDGFFRVRIRPFSSEKTGKNSNYYFHIVPEEAILQNGDDLSDKHAIR